MDTARIFEGMHQVELWPKEEVGCITLAQRIAGVPATNPYCEGGEVLVAPDLNTGSHIASLLDPERTKLCVTTPTGAGLLDAKAALEKNKAPDKKQFVILVTDGADWDQSCPVPNPITVVDQLTAAGISTVVVGFSAEQAVVGAGVGVDFLNDMACAGKTAKGFADSCELVGSGYRSKTRQAKPGDAKLFYTATNTAELVTNLSTFAKSVCCDCVK